MTPPRSESTTRGLLDTSVVIDLERVPVEALPAEPCVSALTMAELAAGPHATDDPAERARRQDRLQRLETTLDPIPFDAAAARALDRKPRGARAVDLMIASVALANELPLFTRNPADFQHLEDVGLRLVSV